MKLLVDVTRPGLALLLSLGLAACGDESSTSGSTTQSAAPVVTFASQVEAGAEAYATNCAICHGANLEGSTLGPLLSGFSWVRRWGTQTPTLLLGNIQANMPPGGNESITEEDYLNIVAHMLQVNGVDGMTEALSASSDFVIEDNISRMVAQQNRPEPPAPEGLTVNGNTEDFIPFIPLTDAMLRDPNPADWPMMRRNFYAHSYSPLDLSLIHI